MKIFRYILIAYNTNELCSYDLSYYIVGVYKTFDEALGKMKKELKEIYDDVENIKEKTWDSSFMGGYRILYDFYYKDKLLYSILEIKV
jgi:hypothetical protein